jgi:hypothetical protein
MPSKRLESIAKREAKHRAYHKNGLNGPRAMARRARQMDSGHGDQFFGYRIDMRVHANPTAKAA